MTETKESQRKPVEPILRNDPGREEGQEVKDKQPS